MCGISAIIAKRPVNVEAIHAMLSRLIHRGPDGEGVWASENRRICFGHRRLSIIDRTEMGAQPMVDSTGQYVIIFNGEIYNYVELKKRLQSNGVSFISNSDTEVLLEAYKFWGEDCVKELNGMFSFSIYDQNKGIIFCGRDRFGEKPFLFLERENYIAFASEYKALFALEGVVADVNDTLLLRFLDQPKQGLDDGRETIFSGISQLLPAEFMVIDVLSLNIKIKRYWDVAPDPQLAKLSDQDAAHRFRDILEDSVRIRMRSDVAVGSCLSGGLDSASIVCLNRKIIGNKKEYNTFTGIFPGSLSDESTYAKVVRDKFNLIGHEIEPIVDDFVKELSDFIWFNELPVGSASQYAQWSVFRLAKSKGITVLLDGQGADEILGGYEQYFNQYIEAISLFEGQETVEKEREKIEARYPLALKTKNSINLLPHGVRWFGANVAGKGSDFLFGVSRDLSKKIKIENQRDLDQQFNPLSQLLKDDALYSHLPTLLRYGDRNSMAHSREVRLPFCDHRIAELSFSLNPKRLMGETETKHLLRNAMKDVLPFEIKNRWHKQGFLPPQEIWFQEELMSMVEGVVFSKTFSKKGYWNKHWWTQVIKRFKAGESHLSAPLWKLLIGEMWQSHFVDRLNLESRVSVFR